MNSIRCENKHVITQIWIDFSIKSCQQNLKKKKCHHWQPSSVNAKWIFIHHSENSFFSTMATMAATTTATTQNSAGKNIQFCFFLKANMLAVESKHLGKTAVMSLNMLVLLLVFVCAVFALAIHKYTACIFHRKLNVIPSINNHESREMGLTRTFNVHQMLIYIHCYKAIFPCQTLYEPPIAHHLIILWTILDANYFPGNDRKPGMEMSARAVWSK